MKAFVAVELALAAAIVWVVGVTRRPREFTLEIDSFDRLQATSLALAVAGLAAVVVWGARRRGLGSVVLIAVGSVGVTVVVGVGRLARLPRTTAWLTAALWLGSAAAVVAVTFVGSHTFAMLPRRPAWVLTGALATTGAFAALFGAGRALATTSDLDAVGRLALGAHVVVLVVGTVWIARKTVQNARTGDGRGALLRDPVVVAAVVWFVVAIYERLVHLLPLSAYRNSYRGAYRPWAVVSAVYVPMIASGALVVALAWALSVRPRVERLSSGVLVMPDRDPIAMLRDDLAAWAGDPTLQLAYADGAGRWLFPSGEEHPNESGYHRATTIVSLEGRPIGLIDHDLSLAQAPDALQAAAELAGVAFHANQLLALSEAHLAETRQVGHRLLFADATTRAELLTELESGPLKRLDDCVDAVRFGGPISDIVDQLRDTTAEVRLLSHGLYPPELIEGGLSAVLGDRVGIPIRRLPTAVEIAAFLLANNDPDSWFEDRGATLWVHRTHPMVERSIVDRVEVLGGWTRGTTVCLPVEEQ